MYVDISIATINKLYIYKPLIFLSAKVSDDVNSNIVKF